MSATRLIPFLSRSRTSRILKISTPSTADIPCRIHNTPRACAKKSKSKQIQNEDIFNDEQDDDLFGSSSTNAQRLKANTSVTTAGPLASGKKFITDPQLEKQLLRADQERVRLFNETYEKLKAKTGTNGKSRFWEPPAQTDLVNLVNHTKTKDDFRRLVEILQQWRVYPGKAPKLTFQNEIVDCAVANGLAVDLIPILQRAPVFGVIINDQLRARSLMKAIVNPTGSSIVDPSSPINAQTESLMVERLNNALQLTILLAAAKVPTAIKRPSTSTSPTEGTETVSSSEGAKSISLSPTEDLVSGMILLTAMLRVAIATTNAEHTADDANPFSAAVELIKSLKDAGDRGTIQAPTLLRDQLWTLAATTESLAWIRGGRWRAAMKVQEKDETEDLIEWLEKTISQLQHGSFSSNRWAKRQGGLSKRFPDILAP